MRGQLQPGTPEFEAFIDRTARRPTGADSVAHYKNPTEHRKDFELALKALELGFDDRYLEIGFGGGQLLMGALNVAHSAAGIDHSPDMLALASERNVKAIVAGRLQLVYGDVSRLPWRDAEFSCAAAVNMFFFVSQPRLCLSELYRVLGPGVRLVIVTVPPTRKAGASGPWAPALHTYSAAIMKSMLVRAGFTSATVTNRDGRQLARARRRDDDGRSRRPRRAER